MSKYEGKERRVDIHASRALNRFRGPDDERIETAQFRESDNTSESMINRVRRLLESVDDSLLMELEPGPMRIRRLVRKQYAGELEVFKEFGLYDLEHPHPQDMPVPSREAISHALLTQLTPLQIAALFERAQRPQLQLEAITSFERYRAAFDAHPKMPRQSNTYLDRNDKVGRRLAAQDAAVGIGNKITGWRVGIIDAVQQLKPTLCGPLGEVCDHIKAELRHSGLRLPHPRRYILAQMRAFKQGKPLDICYRSVLDDDTDDDAIITGGVDGMNYACPVVNISLTETQPTSNCVFERFRPEVVVDI